MDIFGYFLTASVTLIGSSIVALAVCKVEDLYLEWKYQPSNTLTYESPLIDEQDEKEHHE